MKSQTAIPFMVRFAIVCLAAATPACFATKDFELVARATATATYYQDEYVWNCVEKPGPSSCKDCHEALNQAPRIVELANKVQKLGKLPPHEQQELKDLIAKLEKCP